MSAILFGSISTLADTSELQRRAFNEAFAQHGLDWEWGQDEYRELLVGAGGAKRIAEYADARGEDVDAAAIHQSKSEIFQRLLGEGAIAARPGVIDTIRGAKDDGVKVGLVTTTSPDNVTQLIDAVPELDASSFDVVVDATKVDEPKPDAAPYAFALDQLGETATECVAVEDNVDGVASARTAGVACVAFPNENTAGHDFAAASDRVDDTLTLETLQAQLAA